MKVTVAADPNIVHGQFHMKIKAHISAYTNEEVKFDIFIVKIEFTKPVAAPILYKIKDSEHVLAINTF